MVETPQSQNVIAGQEVEFTCATTNSHNIITWAFSKYVGSVYSSAMMLPGGGRRSIQRITAASVEQNQTTVTCVVISGGTAGTYTALLLVQGN